jgi:hypothetical protein
MSIGGAMAMIFPWRLRRQRGMFEFSGIFTAFSYGTETTAVSNGRNHFDISSI